MELQSREDLERTFTRALEHHFNEICPGLDYDHSSSSFSTTRTSTEGFENEKVRSQTSGITMSTLGDFKFGDDSLSMHMEMGKGMGHTTDPSSSFDQELGSLNIEPSFSYGNKSQRHESIDEFLQDMQVSSNEVLISNDVSPDDYNDVKTPEEQVGTIFTYTKDDSGLEESIGVLELDVNSLNTSRTSHLIRKSIKEELTLQEKYEEMVQSGGFARSREKTRKRRNPMCDSLTWEPLSLYTAFTNYKSSEFEHTDYYEKIPKSSCFGKINMRVKRAWTRSANRSKS